MKNSETDTFSYYNVPIAQFADRSIRQLLEEPDNVKGLLEIADENIVARIDCNQLKEAREMPQSIIEKSFQQGRHAVKDAVKDAGRCVCNGRIP